MAFVGLWERWRVREGIKPPRSLAELAPGETLETCTILTTAANETVASVHERMPVILPPESFDAWLGGGAVELGTCPAHEMVVQAAGDWVNKPSNDDPRCVEVLGHCDASTKLEPGAGRPLGKRDVAEINAEP